ncbi:MAG: helix-turn-helix domain-containing protein [Pontibacterium sp.]
MADKSFKENRRVTIEEVARETGIHRTTLPKIANKNGYSTTTEVLDALCEYFGCKIGEKTPCVRFGMASANLEA